ATFAKATADDATFAKATADDATFAKATADKATFGKATADKADGKYEPTVIVSTKNLGNKIEISVKDNGNGIPESVKEKIFQPFFTTKPTGQGSGLGLSLSYDIVKAHGGELYVRTNEGSGSEFIIRL
ncbi:MAG TPA: HAMP domain-containing sensor histidine kinase, partial [Chryseolinea sp.]